MLAQFEAFHVLGFPTLAGVSRKGFLRQALMDAKIPRDPSGLAHALTEATAAANTAAVLAGAHILRVHDVGTARVAAAIADRVLEGAAAAG